MAETRQEKKLNTRRRLISVALDMSAQSGFNQLSLREVAKAANITPAAFYHHFRDMEDLGLSLLDEVGVSLRKFLREARRRVAADRESVSTSVGAFLDYVNENKNLFRLLLGERQGASSAFRKAIHAEIDLFVSELAEDLVRGSEETKRPLYHPEYAAEAIVTVVFTVGAEALELPKHKQESLRSRLTEEVKIILRGARHTPTSSKPTQSPS